MAPCWNGNHFLEHIIFRFFVLLRGYSFFWMFFLSNRADKWQSLHELAIFVRGLHSPPKAHPYHIHILKVEEQNFWQGASEWIWCWCRFWYVHLDEWIFWGNPQHVMRHFRDYDFIWFYISMSIDKRRWDLTMAGAWLKMAGSINYTEPVKWSQLESDSETKTQ